jgi:aspartyl/glutamyl-tRNA(Asn/Gln) amidotransferase C subunit
MAHIDDNTLERLFELARIAPEEDSAKRQKLLKDLQGILGYFEQLQEIDTSETKPLAGGSFLSSVSREDMPQQMQGDEDLLTGQFFEKENEYLKTPPVF